VASGGDGNVRIYTCLSPAYTALSAIRTAGKQHRVDALEDADNVRYDPASNLLYVGFGQGALAIIDPDRAVKLAKISEIPLDGHPESFQLERNGNRIFVNVPTAAEIEVADRQKRSVLTRWRLTDAAENFPMALDDANERLFVGCRKPARLFVLNAASGKVVANLGACGDTDDLFYDSAAKETYLTGGARCISVFGHTNSDSYQEFPTIATPPGSRTSLFLPTNWTLFVAVPHRGSQRAQILMFRAPPNL
jgi:hypothetical protein